MTCVFLVLLERHVAQTHDFSFLQLTFCLVSRLDGGWITLAFLPCWWHERGFLGGQDRTGLFALSHICQFTCLSKLHKSGKSPILSSRPIQWGRVESGVIYCALQLSGGSWPTPETCSRWPLCIWWAFYSCVCKDLKVSGGRTVQILVYEGAMTTYTSPAEFSGIWSRRSLEDVHKTITTCY